MLSFPKTLASQATVDQALRAFEDAHVHMLLVVERGELVGTILRDDLPAGAAGSELVVTHARLIGRVVGANEPLQSVSRRMADRGVRRLAVVEADNKLAGLLCLKRSGAGFCRDADVAARTAERAQSERIQPSRPTAGVEDSEPPPAVALHRGTGMASKDGATTDAKR
ncbi:CBS domain-containing protein [Nocardioides sp. YIM 152315]|uniref:CBS domain-containing protein n=1 Tax=Nocardioides sp. YIM 152315 TaxID=3031760 RepID=UPI0023DC9AEC|nr:CBS domain-containing protein [Nocardioides sp. YIM 152315]MDF1605852.1 CBS domain-containing protein [Nocardioides sp. YIM 152315]